MDRVVGGRYALLSPLTTVGDGTLWRAHDTLLHREVVVREAALVGDAREQARRSAGEEGVFDVVTEDDRLYVVTALLDTPPSRPTQALPLPGRARSRRAPAVVAGALLVALAGAGGWLASTRPDSTGTGTAVGAPAPSAAPAAPAGWQTYTGDGWSVQHPAGWEVGTFKGNVQLRDPATRRTVRIGRGDLPDPGAFAATHTAYAEVRRTSDVWEFTYSDSGADLHAVDTRVGDLVVFTQAKAADWSAAQPLLAQVVASVQAG